jgi:hypothetical protein
MMTVIYTREDGAKIIYDKTVGDIIYAHIVDSEGKKYPSKALDNLLSHGYWEAVQGTDKIDTVTPKFSVIEDED